MEGMVCMRPTRKDVPRSAFLVPRWLRVASLVGAGVVAGCGGGSEKGGGPSGSGAISIQVSGLPGGAAARVTVTAPGGGVTNVTGSRYLTGLADGVYAVSAGYVSAQSQTYTPQVSDASVTVTQNDTADVAIAYTGSPASSMNLQIAGTQLIQSTQRADGAVPMVAGRDALLRVFVTATGGTQAQPSVRVRIFNGGAQVDSVTVGAPGSSVPTGVDTSSLASSWNVLIPAARMISGMSLQAVVDPGDDVAETNETDNQWPAGAPQAVTIQNVPTFAIKLVPVKQSVNNLTGAASNANKDALLDATLRMHPLGAATIGVRATFTTDAPVLTSDDNNGAWSRILSEIYTLKTSDGFAGEYVGMVPATYGSGIAGLGYIGAPAAISWDKASSAPGVIAHELGHNFGRNHAPCGNPAGPDASYPYPNASIGTWGLDLPAMQLKAPGTYKDLMSYCNPDWISDYNYLAVLNYRGTSAVRENSSALSESKAGLMVWGRVRNGTVILEPSFRVYAPAKLPAGPGNHRVEGYDVGGRRVFSVSFAGERVADLPGGEEEHFAFVLPLTENELTGLSSVQLEGNGLIVRQSRAALRAGSSAPTPSAVRQGREVEVRWDSSYPLAVIRDAATGQILSLARNGRSRIAAPGAITVQLSEGVSSLPEVTLGAP